MPGAPATAGWRNQGGAAHDRYGGRAAGGGKGGGIGGGRAGGGRAGGGAATSVNAMMSLYVLRCSAAPGGRGEPRSQGAPAG